MTTDINFSAMPNPSSDLPTNDTQAIQRAIISVSDKSGLDVFAKQLQELGIELFSTGGTARYLIEHNIAVRDVAEYTNFPEMMDGRVKTLHPKIFGGILCRRHLADDMNSVQQHEMLPFDLVVVNLYPFAETIAKPDCSLPMAIENIDIGGPSLVRAAAKNSQFVAIATSPNQYPDIVAELNEKSGTSLALRQRLMKEAFQHTAEYDTTIANYFAQQFDNSAGKQPAADGSSNASELPDSLQLKMTKKTSLRYGENSHQSAALYELSQPFDGQASVNLGLARQLNGKELSFNNLLDLNSALTMVSSFQDSACVVIKHSNPCGAAASGELVDVVDRAFQGDPTSAFGSIVGINRTVDLATAEFLAAGNLFVEAIIAPEFAEDALEVLKTKPKWKKNVRLLESPLLDASQARFDIRQVHGGFLVQHADDLSLNNGEWNLATEQPIDDSLQADLAFAWNMVRFVKSNAILLGKNQMICGVGAGQMSRVDSVKISIDKAGDRAAGCVLASDAFFPFADSIEVAAAAGIVAIIQPGGSVRDPEVIEACKQHNLPMILTGRRHFLH